jgi:HEAT repeat protein
LAVVLLTVGESTLSPLSTQKAWKILEDAHNSHSMKERVNAVKALGQLRDNAHATELAEQSMNDHDADVRIAAALTLGRLGSKQSIPLLKNAVEDKNAKVTLAASSALLSLGDPSGYAVYRDVLIGKRKTGEGPVEEEKRLVKDRKEMTLMALGVAVGFAPYAGYGWAMFQVLSKDYGAPVRVDAAQKLANDRDPETEQVLINATSNKDWRVRLAALDALAHWADPTLTDKLALHLSDKNQAVRCTAAAAIIRSSGPRGSRTAIAAVAH